MTMRPKTSTRSKTLNRANLIDLGAEALTDLLLDVTKGNGAAKQKLRLALAAGSGAGAAAAEIRKRLGTISRSKTFVNWKNRKKLAGDLKAQLAAIETLVAPTDPDEAVDLLWQFLAMAGRVFERTDDSSGTVIGIFHDAVDSLGRIASDGKVDPGALAACGADALEQSEYGEADHLIEALAPALGAEGLADLRARVQAWRARRADDRMTHIVTSLALQQIADAKGDVDAFMAEFEPSDWERPDISYGIAIRLLDAGRAEQAWEVIDAVDPARERGVPEAWEHARAEVLRALGREAEAAEWHRACFRARLPPDHLRAYLKTLPDFDNDEAEEAALAEVTASEDMHKALWFLLEWGAVEAAGALVYHRAKALDGDLYELLSPAAEALADQAPLAATLCLRSMIDFTLGAARSSRYGHAARHLAICERRGSTIFPPTLRTVTMSMGSGRSTHVSQASGAKSPLVLDRRVSTRAWRPSKT